MNYNDLEFLWILNSQGQKYVQRTFDLNLTEFDEELFSGLVTSLSNFSTNIFNDNFEGMNIGGKMIYFKSYSNFQVVISSKQTIMDKNLYHYLEEVGEAFRIQYSDYLSCGDTIDCNSFLDFGSIVDQIFGIETYIYIEEQDKLMKILDNAISHGFSEDYTVKKILEFLDNLDDYKLDIILKNMGENIKSIFENATDLSKLQKKRYKYIL